MLKLNQTQLACFSPLESDAFGSTAPQSKAMSFPPNPKVAPVGFFNHLGALPFLDLAPDME